MNSEQYWPNHANQGAVDATAGCATSPRPGAREMAQQQLSRCLEYWDDALEKELIRARETGQREGREDACREQQAYIETLERDRASLRQQLNTAKERITPVYVQDAVLTQQIEDLRQQLKAAEARKKNTGSVTVIDRDIRPVSHRKQVFDDGSILITLT